MDEGDYDNEHMAYVLQNDNSFYLRENSSSSFIETKRQFNKQASEL